MTGIVDSPFIHPRERVDTFGSALSSREYPSLRDSLSGSPQSFKQLKICILTQDFVGPVKNGGIGTAFTYAARALVDAGHDVTVLYTIKSCVDKSLEYWSEHYAEMGIKFVPAPDPKALIQRGPTAEGLHIAYRAYEWLKQRSDEFDIVHASEWCANAYFCLQAKQTGLYFQNTKFVIKCSSPTLWNRIGNAQPITDVKSLTTMFMERRSVELADYVICGSQYLLNWMEDHGYKIPYPSTFVQPNIFPLSDVARPSKNSVMQVQELVFFGRLEPRKGVHFFVDGLIQLKSRGFFNSHKVPKITFLGKPRAGFNHKAQISKLSEQLGIKVELHDNMHQQEALAYLAGGDGRVAVMPSLMDNSPFGVYECLSLGIPFITSTAGGGHELIDSSQKQSVLFDPTPSSLSDRIEKILTDGCITVSASFDFEQSITDWMEWHLWAADDQPAVVESGVERVAVSPLVSVCMAHHNRGELLKNAINSIQQQTYKNIEIVIVDDGSTDVDALRVLQEVEKTEYAYPVRVIRQRNKYLGAVRNTGIAEANGEYIMFMDDDNEAKPQEVETFVKVAQYSNADILTCWSDSFSSERPPVTAGRARRIVFHGDNTAMALVRNPYGDSNCFVKKAALEFVNGFSEHYKVGLDDSEFFTRAVLSGLKLLLIPEALYWYRINEVRMRQGQYSMFAGRVRMSEPYVQGLHPDLANVIRYAQGMGFVHGPWEKRNSSNNDAVSDVKAPVGLVEFARRVVARFPVLYPVARYVYQKLR